MLITLLYTSYAVSALPLGLFITSDELEVTLEKVINLLKTILPENAFFGRDLLGPILFLTDDSNAERNALKTCWPQGIYIFEILKFNFNSIKNKFKFLKLDININALFLYLSD